MKDRRERWGDASGRATRLSVREVPSIVRRPPNLSLDNTTHYSGASRRRGIVGARARTVRRGIVWGDGAVRQETCVAKKVYLATSLQRKSNSTPTPCSRSLLYPKIHYTPAACSSDRDSNSEIWYFGLRSITERKNEVARVYSGTFYDNLWTIRTSMSFLCFRTFFWRKYPTAT